MANDVAASTPLVEVISDCQPRAPLRISIPPLNDPAVGVLVSLDMRRYAVADEIVIVDKHHVTGRQSACMLQPKEQPAPLVDSDAPISP